MKYLAPLALLLFTAPAWAQVSNNAPPRCTVSTINGGSCVALRQGARAVATDGDGVTDCQTGAGSSVVTCEYTGSAWEAAPAVAGGFEDSVILCGENDEGAPGDGIVYFGPSTGAFGGNGADLSQGEAACDNLDNDTEATADAVILAASGYKVTGFYCTTDATLGASESIVFTLRSGETNLIPSLTCTIGTGASQCSETDSATVAAGSTLAMGVVETSNNADGDESWCRVGIVIN